MRGYGAKHTQSQSLLEWLGLPLGTGRLPRVPAHPEAAHPTVPHFPATAGPLEGGASEGGGVGMGEEPGWSWWPWARKRQRAELEDAQQKPKRPRRNPGNRQI